MAAVEPNTSISKIFVLVAIAAIVEVAASPALAQGFERVQRAPLMVKEWFKAENNYEQASESLVRDRDCMGQAVVAALGAVDLMEKLADELALLTNDDDLVKRTVNYKLDLADKSLKVKCVELADLVYRNVLKDDNAWPQALMRAQTGIADVRARR